MATPGNLLLMGVLLVWTQMEKNRLFYVFLISCLLLGMLVEIIGVRSSLLFGHYYYGSMMGFGIMDTPLIVGVNWFLVIYCSATSVYLIGKRKSSAGWIIGGGALLATFYDWLMEPVASRLGYWRWNEDGAPPLYNYICWFAISALLLSIFHYAKFVKLYVSAQKG